MNHDEAVEEIGRRALHACRPEHTTRLGYPCLRCIDAASGALLAELEAQFNVGTLFEAAGVGGSGNTQ